MITWYLDFQKQQCQQSKTNIQRTYNSKTSKQAKEEELKNTKFKKNDKEIKKRKTKQKTAQKNTTGQLSVYEEGDNKNNFNSTA